MFLLIAAVDHWQLLLVASLYACLSYLMFYTIRRFPLVCQLAWPIFVVWGIAGVHIGLAVAFPETRRDFGKFVIVYLFALPPMVMLYISQIKKILAILKYYRVNKQVGFYIYLKEWLRDKINDEDNHPNTDFFDGDDCVSHLYHIDKVRLN